MNNLLLNFSDWLFESITADSPIKNALNQEAKFNFNFDSGKYLESEVPPDQLENLKKDLMPLIIELAVPKYIDGKTTVDLLSSTSTLKLTPELINKLKSEGYASPSAENDPSGNALLAAARVKTMEDIIIKILSTTLKTTTDSIKSKVQFNKTIKPNQGGGSTPEEMKKWQYMSMKAAQTGNPIADSLKVNCNMRDQLFNGRQGIIANNYVGYASDLYLTIPVGNTITISFNSLDIPDMFYVKYRDVEFLSQFQGSPRHAPNLSKVPELENKINAELAKVGSKSNLKALQPNAVKPDGTWQVIKGQYQGTTAGNYSITINKQWDNDKLIVRVFSPLEATRFNISTVCKDGELAQMIADYQKQF